MTEKKPINQSQLNWLMVCLAIHAVIDFMSVRDVWLPGGSLFLLLAIPMAQCSLVSIWAATSRQNLMLRFAIPAATTLGLWYLFAVILTWDLTAGAARSWLIAFIIQVITIVTVTNLYQRWIAKKANRKRAFAIDLRLIFLWTTTLAMVFGFFQFGRMQWEWGSPRQLWEHGTTVPVFGACNGLLALTSAWPFAHQRLRPRLIRLAIALPVLAVLIVAMQDVVTIWPSKFGWADRGTILRLAGGQAAIILCSLAIVNRWRMPGNT